MMAAVNIGENNDFNGALVALMMILTLKERNFRQLDKGLK